MVRKRDKTFQIALYKAVDLSPSRYNQVLERIIVSSNKIPSSWDMCLNASSWSTRNDKILVSLSFELDLLAGRCYAPGVFTTLKIVTHVGGSGIRPPSLDDGDYREFPTIWLDVEL